MGGKYYRVVYQHPDGPWANRLFGESSPDTIHDTRGHAIAAAKNILKMQGGGRLTVLGYGGQVIFKMTIA